MPKAVWNNQVIAESDKTIEIEGNHYFPPESLNQEFVKQTEKHTTCPWKGEASYLSLKVDGEINENAAWYYPQPSDLAKSIKNYIAFWKGVEIRH